MTPELSFHADFRTEILRGKRLRPVLFGIPLLWSLTRFGPSQVPKKSWSLVPKALRRSTFYSMQTHARAISSQQTPLGHGRESRRVVFRSMYRATRRWGLALTGTAGRLQRKHTSLGYRVAQADHAQTASLPTRPIDCARRWPSLRRPARVF